MTAARPPLARLVALLAWFVTLWLLLWGDVSAANVISGVTLALVVIVFTRGFARPAEDETARISVVGLVVFTGHVLWQLVRSNLELAWEIITPTNTIAVGTIDVPLRSSSPIVAMAVSNVITLTPGTVTVGIGDAPMTLTIGVLHLHEPDELIAAVRRTEALAIKAFGTATARVALDDERTAGATS